MSPYLKLTIAGKPHAKQRPRSTVRGGFVHVYDPQVKDKQIISQMMLSAFKSWTNGNNKEDNLKSAALTQAESYSVKMRFSFAPTESVNAAKKHEMQWGLQDHTCKPDLDNLAKIYLDAGNGVLWTDDRMITDLRIQKNYSSNSKTEIWVMANKKCSMQDKINSVLSVIGPEELYTLMEIGNEMFHLYDVDAEHDWVDRGQGPEDARTIRLTRTAYLLSKMADLFATPLKKIHRANPNCWVEMERFARDLEAIQ